MLVHGPERSRAIPGVPSHPEPSRAIPSRPEPSRAVSSRVCVSHPADPLLRAQRCARLAHLALACFWLRERRYDSDAEDGEEEGIFSNETPTAKAWLEKNQPHFLPSSVAVHQVGPQVRADAPDRAARPCKLGAHPVGSGHRGSGWHHRLPHRSSELSARRALPSAAVCALCVYGIFILGL